MIKIALITIGDEICIGQIVNTNAAFLAWEMTKLGCDVWHHSTIKDGKEVLQKELDKLIPGSDVIIISGGLGPTHDDMTKPALAEYFDDILVFHEESFQTIKEIFSRRNLEISERNRQQAMLPESCTPLKNEVGTAPGMLFNIDGKYIFSLPGVPAELKHITNHSVIPFINKIIDDKKSDINIYKVIQTAGIAESNLADLIGSLDFLDGASLAFLPNYRGVRLRIGVNAIDKNEGNKKIEKIENHIYQKAGKYIISSSDENTVEKAAKLLIEQGKTVAVAESCTAGMLGVALTDVSGSSAYFIGGMQTYSNEAKINQLKVKKDTIIKFGAVSEQTALEMARNIRNIFNSDFGISITGIAGPTGGSKEKPVGTVWIGLSSKDRTYAKHFNFGKIRSINRERSVASAIYMLLKELM